MPTNIQASGILMFSDLQCWQRQSYWLDLHLLKVNITIWIN